MAQRRNDGARRTTFSVYMRTDFIDALLNLETDRSLNPSRMSRPQLIEAAIGAILSGHLAINSETHELVCKCCAQTMSAPRMPQAVKLPLHFPGTPSAAYEQPKAPNPLTIPLLGGAATPAPRAPIPPAAPATPVPQVPQVLSPPAPTAFFEGETPAQINRRRYDFMIYLLSTLMSRPDIAARLPPEILNNPACALLLPQGTAGQWDPQGPAGPALAERAARGYANGAFNQFLAERLPALLELPEALAAEEPAPPSDFTS